MTAGKSIRDRVAEVLGAHNIECTGPGEVSCRGCRELHWMSWTAYRIHLADALAAAGLLADGGWRADLASLIERNERARQDAIAYDGVDRPAVISVRSLTDLLEAKP